MKFMKPVIIYTIIAFGVGFGVSFGIPLGRTLGQVASSKILVAVFGAEIDEDSDL